MGNFKKDNRIVPHSDDRLTAVPRFTPEALAEVLTEDLRLTPDVPLHVAYSGGMDSHVLLHALVRVRERMPWQVTVLHIDHGLQPDSRRWSEHCAAVCEALRVPYVCERVVVRDIAARGREDAARQARYQALASRLPAGGVLLTAHHQDDQAETLLLQLLRGGSIAGMAAMPAIADFASGRLARPLLNFQRHALEAYARENALHWVEDNSNRDESLARNYIRHRIWPLLVQRWPQAAEQLSVAARHHAQAAELLDAIGEIDLKGVTDGNSDISIAHLTQLTPARQANAVRRWIGRFGLPLPNERVLDEILARVRVCPRSQYASVRWGNVEVQRYRDRLVVNRVAAEAPIGWETAWNVEVPLEIPGSGWVLRARPSRGLGLADRHAQGRALRVCLRQGGERFRLRGHEHKVKKLLQEAGIAPWERERLPLVYVGDELAAIGDRWVSDLFAAKPDESSLVLVLDRSRAP